MRRKQYADRRTREQEPRVTIRENIEPERERVRNVIMERPTLPIFNLFGSEPRSDSDD